MIPLDALAQGALPLDRAAAGGALERLGRHLGGRDAVMTAEGVLTIANARIEAALRHVSVERGHDPRGAALVAFGGAGGLHACALAESLACAAVVWPRHAGVLSALGALTGGSRRERSRSVLHDARDRAALERVWRGLEREVMGEFARGERGRVRLERWAEVRYRGQSHEIPLAGADRLAERFHRAHEQRFGFADPDREVEVVTLEVRGSLPAEAIGRASRRAARGTARPIRRVRVRHRGSWLGAAVWSVADLSAGAWLRGPALVLEPGATLWVAPGWSARARRSGALVLTHGAGR